MAVLEKHRTVCEIDPSHRFATQRYVVATQHDDDTGGDFVVAFLERSDWEDFGSPEKVTVSFEPGDLLNP